MNNRLQDNATCLDRRKNDLTEIAGCSLEIKCFNSNCNPWRELETLHILLLPEISS